MPFPKLTFRSRTQNSIVCTSNPGEPVFVNVYNLRWPNGMKVGAYHTGTVVYGHEYGYGGHQFSTSGIFEVDPCDIDQLGGFFDFRESLFVGTTYLSPAGVSRLLLSMTDEFPGDAYHLLNFNCNTFTADFIKLLCNGVLPKWVTMLTKFVSGLPFIESLIPAHMIRPPQMEDLDGDFEEDVTEERDFAHIAGLCNGTVTGNARRCTSSDTPSDRPGARLLGCGDRRNSAASSVKTPCFSD